MRHQKKFCLSLFALLIQGTFVYAEEINTVAPTSAITPKPKKVKNKVYNVLIGNSKENIDSIVLFDTNNIYLPVKFLSQNLINNLNTEHITVYDDQPSLKIDNKYVTSRDDENFTISVFLDETYLKNKKFQIDGDKLVESKPIGAAYINYQLNAHEDGKVKLTSLDMNYKSSNNWAIQNMMTSGQNNQLIRYTSTASKQFENKTRLKIGDTMSTAIDGFNSVNMGGISYTTPYFNDSKYLNDLMPMIAINGVAVQPSKMDIYLNNQLVQKDDVSAGKYNIDLHAVGHGMGEASAYVYDVSGKPVVFSVPFYSSPNILRKESFEYAVSGGAVRKNLGYKSFDYGGYVTNALMKYGFSDSYTQDFFTTVSKDYSAVSGLGHYLISPSIGILNFGLSLNDKHQHLEKFGYERFANTSNIGFDITKGNEFCYGFNQLDCLKKQIQIFGGTNLPHKAGNISFNYIDRDTNKTGRNRSTALRYNTNITNKSSIYVSLENTKNEYYSNRGIYVGLNVLLGDRLNSNSSYSKNSSDGTYTMMENLSFSGDTQNANYGSGSLNYQQVSNGQKTTNFFYNSQAENFKYYLNAFQTNDNKLYYDASLQGALVYIPQDNYFSLKKPIYSGLSYVKVENAKEPISIMFENRYAGLTNDKGQYVITDVIPLVKQKASIDINNLPETVTMDKSDIEFYPPYVGTSQVTFKLQNLPYMIRISGVSKGTIFTIKDDTYVVGKDGTTSILEEGEVKLFNEKSGKQCVLNINRKQKKYECAE